MTLALILSAIAMTLIVGVRYLLASGAFALATKRGIRTSMPGSIRRSGGKSGSPRLRRDLRRAGRNRRLGLAESRLDANLRDIHAWPLWYWPVSVLLYLIAHDTWFYWTHRWMHRPAVFKARTRRPSRQPTADRLGRHGLSSDRGGTTGAVVIPLLVFSDSDSHRALGLVLTIMTVMGVTNHMGWEIFPRFLWQGHLGGGSSPQAIINGIMQYGCNYGLYFRFWDRLCGTDRGLGDFGAPMRRPRASAWCWPPCR